MAGVFYNKFCSVTDSSSEVGEIELRKLKDGIGFDEIHSNHLKFASKNMIFYHEIFILLIIHNYFPKRMLSEGIG